MGCKDKNKYWLIQIIMLFFGAISCFFQRKVVYLQKTFWMMAKCS